MTNGAGAGRVGLLDVGAFLAELAMLVALGYAGGVLPTSTAGSVAAAILLPTAAAVVWGRWLAPRASRPLPRRRALLVKVAILAVASVLLALAGPAWLALTFAVVTEVVTVAADRRHPSTRVGPSRAGRGGRRAGYR